MATKSMRHTPHNTIFEQVVTALAENVIPHIHSFMMRKNIGNQEKLKKFELETELLSKSRCCNALFFVYETILAVSLYSSLRMACASRVLTITLLQGEAPRFVCHARYHCRARGFTFCLPGVTVSSRTHAFCRSSVLCRRALPTRDRPLARTSLRYRKQIPPKKEPMFYR
jgi:hypothetical protein